MVTSHFCHLWAQKNPLKISYGNRAIAEEILECKSKGKKSQRHQDEDFSTRRALRDRIVRRNSVPKRVFRSIDMCDDDVEWHYTARGHLMIQILFVHRWYRVNDKVEVWYLRHIDADEYYACIQHWKKINDQLYSNARTFRAQHSRLRATISQDRQKRREDTRDDTVDVETMTETQHAAPTTASRSGTTAPPKLSMQRHQARWRRRHLE